MMIPCLGGIVARDFSDDSSDDEPRPITTDTTVTTATTNTTNINTTAAPPTSSIKAATPFGFPKAAKRQIVEPNNNNNNTTTDNETTSSPGATAATTTTNKTVYFDPANATQPSTTTLTKPTPKARSSAPSAMVGEKPLSDEELSLMGWWVTDPVGRMGCATNCTIPTESDAVPESGSQMWLSRRSELMSVEKRLSTLVRCMQSSAPQHQRSFLSVSRALLKQQHHTRQLSEVGNRLRGLFITDGTDSAMRWFRLFQIIEESSTGAYRHRGAITTPMPVITEEGLGLVGDILRPFMAPICSPSFLGDLANPEPLRAENVAAQLVDVLRGKAEEGEEGAVSKHDDKPLSVETLLIPPCPTFEEIGTLLVSIKNEKTTTSSDRVEFEAAAPGGAAERALMTGINLEEPVTNRTIEAFNTAYYGDDDDDDAAEQNRVKQERDLGVPVHQLALALTHLAAPELILHLLSESFELARSTSMGAVSIADNRQQSPLSITALLRFALFLCEHHPLASHRLTLTELQPQQQQQNDQSSENSHAAQISKKSGSVAAKCTVLRILDSLSGMLVEDYEQLLMGGGFSEEGEEGSTSSSSALLDVMFLTARFMGYLIPAAVATEQLSLHDPANASDILRMVAALSTATIRKATDVLVLSIGLMEQLESGEDSSASSKTTQAWLACWVTARTAVVHEALLEHERSAKGGDAMGFACSSAASELLPLALRWTNRGSIILGGAVHQANQTSSGGGDEHHTHSNIADVKLLRSAGEENAMGQDPSGWTQTMVSSACATLVASSNSNNTRNGSELYRLVAAVYLVAQYRKCKTQATTTPTSTPTARLLLLVESGGDNNGAFTPLGKAMWDFVQEGLEAASTTTTTTTTHHHLGLTVSIAKDLVEELVLCCEGIAPVDDFEFTEEDGSTTTQPAALQALVSLIVAIGSLVEHTLHPISVTIQNVPQSDRRNTLLTSLGMLTPEVADSLLQAVIVMETVSMSSSVYTSVRALLPPTTASLLASPVALVALAGITATRTEATQQAPLLVAAVVNRYLKTVVSVSSINNNSDDDTTTSSTLKLPNPNAIGTFMVKLDELLSTSEEYYDPTSLFGFRRPIVNDGGAIDLKKIEEFGEAAAGMVRMNEDEDTVMNASEADNTAMLLVWRIMTTSMVWLQNTNMINTTDDNDDIGGILKVLVDTEGLFSEVLMWRLQAASAGILFPSITTSHNDACRPVYECVLSTLCHIGIDSNCTPLWPLTRLPNGALGRHHVIEVVSDLILTVIGTPVTTSTSTSTSSLSSVSATGGWSVVEKELGPLTEALGFQSVPPSVIRALLGSLAAATPLLSTPSSSSSGDGDGTTTTTTSLAANISAPPPTTLVAMVRLICTDGFLASYNALQHQQQTSSPSSTSNNSQQRQHVPLMDIATVRKHAQQQQQGSASLLAPWSEQQVITMAEEFGSVALRHTQTLHGCGTTTSSSIHPLRVVAHLIRWASACTLLRRKAFVSDAPDTLEIATDIISELGLEQYQLLA